MRLREKKVFFALFTVFASVVFHKWDNGMKMKKIHCGISFILHYSQQVKGNEVQLGFYFSKKISIWCLTWCIKTKSSEGNVRQFILFIKLLEIFFLGSPDAEPTVFHLLWVSCLFFSFSVVLIRTSACTAPSPLLPSIGTARVEAKWGQTHGRGEGVGEVSGQTRRYLNFVAASKLQLFLNYFFLYRRIFSSVSSSSTSALCVFAHVGADSKQPHPLVVFLYEILWPAANT